MSYNWKCCSFYPNNFDASALTEMSIRADRNTPTRQPKQPIITYKKRHSFEESCAFFIGMLGMSLF